MRFISLDFETTGLKPTQHEVIEVACLKFEQGQVVDKFVSLVKPEKSISEKISGLTNITNAMVANAPSWGQIAPQVSQFIGNDLLVAYNAQFDKRFLNVGFYRSNIHSHFNPYLCAMGLTIEAFDLKYWPKLVQAAALWQIPVNQDGLHRAEMDAYYNGVIFHKAITTLQLDSAAILSRSQPLKVPNPKYTKDTSK